MKRIKYRMKDDVSDRIKNTYKYSYFISELGYTKSYISLVLSGKKEIPKCSAYALTKVINRDSEIEDYFEEV